MSAELDYGIVCVATSAGGLRALGTIFEDLAGDFPVPIVVVQHLHRARRSMMAEILRRKTTLRVEQACGGERVVAGCIYFAPPDNHLVVNRDRTLRLDHSDRVHFVRPSADVLFESVAGSFGKRSIAVVATGTGSDGAAGVSAIKRVGGTVIVQDEPSSEFFGMPAAAIETGDVDLVLPLGRIAGALTELVTGSTSR